MASHRKPRPGGTPGAGIRTPALATAALTSLAVLSQTAEAGAEAGHGRPSPEEVERKIDDLYRRAESATGTAGTAEEPARAPRRQADSLQRLRDEVARRAARARAVPAPRGPVPAANAATLPPERGGDAVAPTGRAGAATPAEGRAAVTPGRSGGGVAPAPGGDVTTLAPAAPAGDAVMPVRGVALVPPGEAMVPGRAAVVVPPADSAVPPADSLPEVTAGAGRDPKAVKAAVQRKLAHARVLLARRTAQGSAPSGTDAAKAGKAVAFARAQLGKPCVWGAAGPGSYDCSGLTQAAWKSAGVTLPRTARDQAAAGTTVPPADARPGDLVFFHDDRRHVGLCTGDGMMIHAPRPGAYVREEPISSAGESAVHSVVRPV
ncbi:NlpC/P60 family protein [Streptomyces sp. NPDC014991]|uniref:C40 family peptidase n=1 Tax=Streptomyces sp. NPDC014991 TaxID=3364935 RepID=UPI0036F8BDAB